MRAEATVVSLRRSQSIQYKLTSVQRDALRRVAFEVCVGPLVQ
jgi:hypothetical protein